MIRILKSCLHPQRVEPGYDGTDDKYNGNADADESSEDSVARRNEENENKDDGDRNPSPWLADVKFDIPNDEPIDPVSELDERSAVRDLLDEKQDKIDKIREHLKKEEPLFDPRKHDDIWILRFSLSHKKTKNAVKAARECIAFRREHNLDDTDVRDTPPHKATDRESPCLRYFQFCDFPAIASTVPDETLSVVSFLFFDAIHHDRLAEELTDDELLAFFIRGSEFTFQWCDYVTRTTGRLTKTLRIADFDGVSRENIHLEQFRREGKLLGTTDGVYPQMLEMLIICNAPRWMNGPWKVIRPLFPKKVLSKMDFAQPRTDEKERRRLLRHISEDNLPVAFGGKNTVQPWEW